MNRRWLLGAGAVVVVPVVAFMTMLSMSADMVAGSSKAPTATCSTGASSDGSSTALASIVLPAKSAAGVKLDAAQLQNAATIVSVGQSLNASDSGIQVALMVSMQESNLRNLANTTVAESMTYPHDGTGHDHDSVNMFQQRPSAGWGTVKELMDPTYAARAFFGGPTGPNKGSPRGLLDIASWQSLPLGVAAQTVQVSKYPGAYAKWIDASAALLKAAGTAGVSCTTDTTAVASGSWQAPNGKTGQDLVAYAEQFVGKVPYSGACGSVGSPTAGWCCTGFVYYVYHQVLGIDLPSPVVSGQLAMAHQIPESQAQAGDLVAWVGHHIGIDDGKGGLLHSPDWGRKLEHAKSYNFTIGGVGPTFYRVDAIGSGNW